MAKDPLKQAAAVKKYYERHKADYFARNALKRQRIREWFEAYKEANPCLDCRLFYPSYVMDFDHRPGTEKLYQPNQLVNRLSWKILFEEIAKCDLVCSNCHRFRTYMRLGAKSKQKEIGPEGPSV